MAKKKNSQKNSGCPEPFNTLIDIAGAMTLDYINYKRRQKKGSSRKRVDPYAAAGAAMGMGRLNSTEDILAMGGLLGAMGAFDEEDDLSIAPRRNASISHRRTSSSTSNRNRYAWRLNCEDGTAFGIQPTMFETRAEYNEAIRRAKESRNAGSSPVGISSTQEQDIEEEESNNEQFTFCRVSRLDNGENVYYLAGDLPQTVGSVVEVPTDTGVVQAVILSVEQHTRKTAPRPPEDTDSILQ